MPQQEPAEYLQVTVRELRTRFLWLTFSLGLFVGFLSIPLLLGPNKSEGAYFALIGPLFVWLGVSIYHVGIMNVHKSRNKGDR